MYMCTPFLTYHVFLDSTSSECKLLVVKQFHCTCTCMLLTSPPQGGGSSTHRVCLCVCYRSNGHCGYLTSETLDLTNKNNIGILPKMFSLTVITVLAHRENFTWCFRHKIDISWSLSLLLDYWYVKRGV